MAGRPPAAVPVKHESQRSNEPVKVEPQRGNLSAGGLRLSFMGERGEGGVVGTPMSTGRRVGIPDSGTRSRTMGSTYLNSSSASEVDLSADMAQLRVALANLHSEVDRSVLSPDETRRSARMAVPEVADSPPWRRSPLFSDGSASYQSSMPTRAIKVEGGSAHRSIKIEPETGAVALLRAKLQESQAREESAAREIQQLRSSAEEVSRLAEAAQSEAEAWAQDQVRRAKQDADARVAQIQAEAEAGVDEAVQLAEKLAASEARAVASLEAAERRNPGLLADMQAQLHQMQLQATARDQEADQQLAEATAREAELSQQLRAAEAKLAETLVASAETENLRADDAQRWQAELAAVKEEARAQVVEAQAGLEEAAQMIAASDQRANARIDDHASAVLQAETRCRMAIQAQREAEACASAAEARAVAAEAQIEATERKSKAVLEEAHRINAAAAASSEKIQLQVSQAQQRTKEAEMEAEEAKRSAHEAKKAAAAMIADADNRIMQVQAMIDEVEKEAQQNKDSAAVLATAEATAASIVASARREAAALLEREREQVAHAKLDPRPWDSPAGTVGDLNSTMADIAAERRRNGERVAMMEQRAEAAITAAWQEAQTEAERKIKLVSESMGAEYEHLLAALRTQLADKSSELQATHAQTQQLQADRVGHQESLARAAEQMSELTSELERERSAARQAVADAELARAEAAEMKAGVIAWVQEKTHGRGHGVLQGQQEHSASPPTRSASTSPPESAQHVASQWSPQHAERVATTEMYNEYSRKLADKDAVILQMQDELDRGAARRAEDAQQTASAKTILARLRAENQSLAAEAGRLRADAAESAGRGASSDADHSATVMLLREAEQRADDAENRTRQANEIAKSVVQDVGELQSQAEAQVREAVATEHAARTAAREAADQLATVEREFAAAQAERQSAQQEIDRLKAAAADSQAEAVTIRQQLEKARATEAELVELRQQLATAASAEAELATMRQELEVARADADASQVRLAAAASELARKAALKEAVISDRSERRNEAAKKAARVQEQQQERLALYRRLEEAASLVEGAAGQEEDRRAAAQAEAAEEVLDLREELQSSRAAEHVCRAERAKLQDELVQAQDDLLSARGQLESAAVETRESSEAMGALKAALTAANAEAEAAAATVAQAEATAAEKLQQEEQLRSQLRSQVKEQQETVREVVATGAKLQEALETDLAAANAKAAAQAEVAASAAENSLRVEETVRELRSQAKEHEEAVRELVATAAATKEAFEAELAGGSQQAAGGSSCHTRAGS